MRPPASPADLLARWSRDAARLAPEAPAGLRDQEGTLLVAGWSEPHRAYHTLQHLAEVLDALEELQDAGELDEQDALVARVAGWYHDLVYQPRAQPGSNEHRSAALARDHLHRLGAPDPFVDLVEDLVLLTADHGGATGADPAAAAFHDADLWILGAPAARYTQYTEQVRREYAHVPAAAFAAGRARVLRGLRGPDGLYRTPTARRRWGPAAERNLAAELAVLEAGGG